MTGVPCASVVDSLVYAMVRKTLDISQAFSIVSKYLHNPGKGYWWAVKSILQYILNTIYGLKFKQDKNLG